MNRPVLVASSGRLRGLAELPSPLALEELVPYARRWELEIGAGKGRYLVDRAMAEPENAFVGIEVADPYFRMFVEGAEKRALTNVLAIRGEAEMVMATVLPRRFAAALHVYFPDPWPKARHEDRRLFSKGIVDLMVGLLLPGGMLSVATDDLAYGRTAEDLFGAHGSLSVRRRHRWPRGPRTNYEVKYVREGRPIVRLEATRAGGEEIR